MIDIIKDYLKQFNFTGFLHSITVEEVLYVSVGIVLVLLPLVFRKTLANFINKRVEFFLNKLNVNKTSITKTVDGMQRPLQLLGYLIALSIIINYFNLNTESSTFITNVKKL